MSTMNVYSSPEIAFDPGAPRDFSPKEAKSFGVMLGSGKPEPTPHRFGPGGAIIANDQPYLIDAGEGIWRAIAKAAISNEGKLITHLDPAKLRHVFITHLHSDHTVGLASLILLPWTCGRNHPLHVYGPVGTSKLVDSILDAYTADIDERVNGPERKDPTGGWAFAHEIEGPGKVYQDDNICVESFLHTHGGWRQNFGYRFVTSDRTFVWAGDGVEGPTFQEAARGADVLFSDASPDAEAKDAFPWREYDEDVNESNIWHIKTGKLGELAQEADVKCVAIHHEQNYSSPYDPESLACQVKERFGGRVISARDGDIF